MADEPVSRYLSEIGRKGGKISGARRMTNYTDEERSEIASKAARARWGHRMSVAKPKRPRKPNEKPRAICATCGEERPINADGRMRGHWPRDPKLTEQQRMRCGNGWSPPKGSR